MENYPIHDRYILSAVVERMSYLKEHAMDVEDQISRKVLGNEDVRRIMSITGINVYSASVIMAEIDSISRFGSREKLAAYAGLFPDRISQETWILKDTLQNMGPPCFVSFS